MRAQVTVSGTVLDSAGETLIGVTVMEKGTSLGCTTNIDGQFTLEVKSPKSVLVFSYVGMDTQEIPLNGRTKLQVTMAESAIALAETVVVGYGTQKKSDLTGSVASLSEAQMKQTIVTNADQMLQGKVAGVQVTQNSGAPGGATSIRIRGASSLNSSNEPLYVIDGVPMSGAAGSIGGFDWAGGTNGQTTVNPLAAIAPSDIVSIDVLKDASACAIYGAAGANGVVIVTTRRGSAGHTNITYDGYVAWQKTAKRLEMMDLRQYAQYQQSLFNDGIISETMFDKTYSDVSLLGKGTDWQDQIFRTAVMHSHQVGVNGGNDKTTFAASAGYMNQEGIIIGSDFNRFNTRLNIDNNFTKWLKVGASLAYTRTNERITRNDGSDGVIMQAMTMMPVVPVRDFDGNWAGPSTVNGSSTWNPVALALQTNNTLLRQRIMGDFYAEAKFLKYLTFRAEFAFDGSQNQNKSYIPRYEFGVVSNDINQMMQREEHSWFWMQKDYLTYNQTFADKHNLTAMVGFEASKSSWEGTQLIKKNFTTDIIHVMTEDGEFVSNTGWSDAASNTSFFGRVNYGYDNRYLVTATIRADGSSKFGPSNKWGVFPSAAAAWRISQEKWMENARWLDNLKLRLGYGQVGNSNIDTYRYASAMMSMLTPHGTAYFPQNLSNPKLKWESSEQFNIGLDFAAFNNRLEITVDFYKKQTKDLLMQVFTPSQIASNDYQTILNPYANIGKTENMGVDLQITARPVVTKDFTWLSSVTLSHNKNKVVALNDDSQVLYGAVDWWAPFQTATMFKVGQPMGVFYGYQTEGLFANEADILSHATQTGGSTPYANKIDRETGAWVGDIKFVDQNGDGVINDADQVVIGDPNPTLTYGWTNTFTWREWELNIGITGQVGGDILNWARYKTEGLTSIWDNQDQRVLNRAQIGLRDPNGSRTDISNVYLLDGSNGLPRFSNLDGNGNNRMSDRWIEDGTYLRIQNISLAYNLPQKWAKKAGLTRAKLYFNVQNVYTFTSYTGYDPEIGAYNQSALLQNIDRGRYPSPRMFTLGLNLGF
ncbi:MAG: TonB-dependent receptor [Bacteroidaceae bacterium]|nr:TonB-dependent receptor [Bacteroidaceae bacterium]